MADIDRADASELLALAQDFAAWDKRYPKGVIHSMKGERELDELFARSRALVAKTTGQEARRA